MPATRRQLLRRTKRAAIKRPGAPSRLHATVTKTAGVSLGWRASASAKRVKGQKKAPVVKYEVLRNGRKIATTKRLAYVDKKAAKGKTYTYAVRTLDHLGHRSKATAGLKVLVKAPAETHATTPAAAKKPAATKPPAKTTPPKQATPAPQDEVWADPPKVPTPPPADIGGTLTTDMVDRLLWRAGFGPSGADRQTWTGRPVVDLVEYLLSTPQSLDGTIPPPLTASNASIDPLATREELVMEWLDTMTRARNPLTERLTLFWHRHFAVSRADGISAPFMVSYRNRLRSYGDLAANPNASFRDLAVEMTTRDAAMSQWLNGNSNVKGRPNENYAREFMELFTLGVTDASGNANYTQDDVANLAKAFTGWRLDGTTTSATYGAITFNKNNFDATQKTIFGHHANFGADPSVGAGSKNVVDYVLQHEAHAPFVVRKLWAEFISEPIPDDALAAGVAQYLGNDLKLRPLVRMILGHPLMFARLEEPSMIKPPVVYLVGAMRAIGAPQRGTWSRDMLANMEQIPFEPPNVAGWEGGPAWLNTNTARARFDAAQRVLNLKHLAWDASRSSIGYPGAQPLTDVGASETAAAAFDRAYAACGSPWMSAATRSKLQAFSTAHPSVTATNRLQRQYALRSLVLGGPDSQVM